MAISRRLLIGRIGGIGALGAVLAACGGDAAPAAAPTAAAKAEPTKAPAAAPTAAPQPTAAPTAAAKPVTITFWHTQTGGNQAALDAIVDAFNKSNPQKITVKIGRAHV